MDTKKSLRNSKVTNAYATDFEIAHDHLHKHITSHRVRCGGLWRSHQGPVICASFDSTPNAV